MGPSGPPFLPGDLVLFFFVSDSCSSGSEFAVVCLVRFRFWGLTGWLLVRSGLVSLDLEMGMGTNVQIHVSWGHRIWLCFDGEIRFR